MNQYFDYFNLPEKVSLVLCNPAKTEICALGAAYNLNLSMVFNGMSEFSFDIPKTIDGEEVEAYELIKSKRLVKVGDIGYFRIENPEQELDGVQTTKHVVAYSLESELINKKVTLFGGTFKLYDPVSPTGTVMQYIVDTSKTWAIGYVDGDLLNKYRTFDISDTNLYNFMMDDVAKAFGCIFTFDTIAKTISVYARANVTTSTDIFLSFDNLVTNSTIKEMSEEIVTCLKVYGSGDLDIRSVNPLGTTAIYDFSYYKTTDWMSQGLVDAITTWEALVTANQATYADTLTALKVANEELVDLETELVELETEWTALEGVQKARIEDGQDFADITVLMDAKQLEIDAKELEITLKEAEIETFQTTLEGINDLLSFDNNFTADQLLELDVFTIENTYQNENFIQTDIMTQAEIQDVAQALYDQAIDVLDVVSQPRYEFSVSSGNFVMLPEFSSFTSQLALGSTITLKIREDYLVEAAVLEINITFDNPEEFSLTLSNRLRLDNGKFVFSDLFGQAVKAGTSVKFDKAKWADWSESYKNDVTSFITSALNATTNEIINSTNQEITLGENGLRGRQLLEGGGYSPNQVWLTSSILAFTDDNWATAKLALGSIPITETTDAYGLVADVIVGRLLAGESLRIENEGNNFVLDQNGAVLNNASFTITSTDGKSKIYLDANIGIKVQTQIAGTWTDKLYIDTSGNLVFTGDLSGASGTFTGHVSATSGLIGGWTITEIGIEDTHGNYLRSDGSLKVGQLLVEGDVTTFSGAVYADQIYGELMNHQIADGAITNNKIVEVQASKVTSGTMSGDRIYGGTISWAGVTMSAIASGVMQIATTDSLYLTGGSGSQVRITSGGVALQGTTISASGVFQANGTLYAYGNIVVGSGISLTGYGSGLTTNQQVTTPSGTKTLKFARGILYQIA